MTTRTMLWGVVCGGMMGALLWAGPAGAQPFPGGLPQCRADLNTCQANLGTCQDDLAMCQAEPSVVFPGDGVNGPALRYQDNGNGTTTDLNTGLMWEQKLAGSDPACTAPMPSVHCVDNQYTWTDPGDSDFTNPDGTAFTVFLDSLNNKCDGDETTVCTSNAPCTGIGNGLCGHAGFRDWRMPTIKELQSLVDYGRCGPPESSPPCADPVAVDPTFPGATAGAYYWSFTSTVVNPSDAWCVGFDHGDVIRCLEKEGPQPVRAVRGGQ